MNKLTKISILLLVIAFLSPSNLFGKTISTTENGKKAKYLFLFIGDGMGLAQTNSTNIYLKSLAEGQGKNKLSFTSFPSQGITSTRCANSYITDSGAAATAIACSEKTYSGVIGMDAKKERKLTSIAERMKDAGKKVGIVSSVSIDHATPAGFYAHQKSRSMYYDIAMDLSKSDFDYFGGGALKKPTGRENDKRDAYEIIKENGYKIVNTIKDFNELSADDNKVMAYNPVLAGGNALPYTIDKVKGGISLAEFTQKGIELLDNEEGFFMMVEGGKIDWACHANDAASAIIDLVAFDDAIEKAVDFYNKHPEETIIVVTGDHETGGMTIGFAGTGYETYMHNISKQKISNGEFSDIMAKYIENHSREEAKLDDILADVEKYYGMKKLEKNIVDSLIAAAKDGDEKAGRELEMVLSEYDISEIKEALAESYDRKEQGKEYQKSEEAYLSYGYYDPLAVSITHILNGKSGIGFTTYSHTGTPLSTYAIGNGSKMFNSYYENTEISKKLLKISGIEVK